MGLVCRSARGHLPRKRQRRRSLTVWKAETNRADYLGARRLRTAPLGVQGGNRDLLQHARLDSSQQVPAASLQPQGTDSSPDEMKRHTEVCNAQQEDQEWKTGGGGEARSPYATTWLSSMDQLQDRCKFVPGR
ncbi:putative uncharacterized protein encoded by MIR7-3HG isoform X1 [Myotis myotis]|uniref:putative uncharacterized protein encoded by MIR7-3HG isoform X1 n=1 Tax=Myotis myotis TaxID=51298 RepID=UPI00174B8E88|nr:putative uncharacterized protein encoded by MIR7-3HG isoform X1 [Myotis myotis]